MKHNKKKEYWFLDGKRVSGERVKSFQNLGGRYKLKVEYFSGLRELLKINTVKRIVKSSNVTDIDEFKVIDEKRIMVDEGDGDVEPGTTLILEKQIS